MKKILFATTAIAGLATVATPAMADALELDLGGFYRGYGVYADNDDATLRDFDLRHDAEIHFTGETTLDNGLTVGVHSEMDMAVDNADAANADDQALDQDEIYAYMEGTWGRINWGQEDGAAYLLQVAAPSADSNIDGLRTQIQGIDTSALTVGSSVLDYAQDMNGLGEAATKITYLTPKFGGFQAGVSYAPEVSDDPNVLGNGLATPATDTQTTDFEDLMEAGVRFDGAWDEIGFSIGAGYGTASPEVTAATGVGSDDFEQWNVGVNFQWMAFELGGAWLDSNNGFDTGGDSETWVAGLGWNNGPYTAGVSYLDRSTDVGATDEDADRWTVGGTYTYGPGMTFRGAVAFGDIDTVATDNDYTQVTLGTEINF